MHVAPFCISVTVVVEEEGPVSVFRSPEDEGKRWRRMGINGLSYEHVRRVDDGRGNIAGGSPEIPLLSQIPDTSPPPKPGADICAEGATGSS